MNRKNDDNQDQYEGYKKSNINQPRTMHSRDRYRHEHIQNPLPNRHGREESYRARAEFDSELRNRRFDDKFYEPGELSYEQQYRTDGEAHNYNGWIDEQRFNEYPRYGENLNSIENRLRNNAGKGPKGYKRSDESIEEDVCEILMKDRYIDASEIEVIVRDGIAILSGSVERTNERFAAEMAIEGVSGLQDIQNDIKVSRRNEMH